VPGLDPYQNIRAGERGAWASIAAYLLLSGIKLAAGYVLSSSALTADGYNNLTDIAASAAVLIGLRISRKPPDKDHPYGHFRAETIAALIASFIMAMVGLQVLIDAGRSITAGDRPRRIRHPPGSRLAPRSSCLASTPTTGGWRRASAARR
jgi:cation diffusion facilitator family transporter